jgi:hypothetical protein
MLDLLDEVLGSPSHTEPHRRTALIPPGAITPGGLSCTPRLDALFGRPSGSLTCPSGIVPVSAGTLEGI